MTHSTSSKPELDHPAVVHKPTYFGAIVPGEKGGSLATRLGQVTHDAVVTVPTVLLAGFAGNEFVQGNVDMMNSYLLAIGWPTIVSFGIYTAQRASWSLLSKARSMPRSSQIESKLREELRSNYAIKQAVHVAASYALGAWHGSGPQ